MSEQAVVDELLLHAASAGPLANELAAVIRALRVDVREARIQWEYFQMRTGSLEVTLRTICGYADNRHVAFDDNVTLDLIRSAAAHALECSAKRPAILPGSVRR